MTEMSMKTLILILALASLCTLNAGPIKNMAVNDPEGTLNFIRAADYATLLQFVRDAHAEYLVENKDPVLEYTYIIGINEASLDKQVRLALDFSLAQSDMNVRQMGARAIWLALIKGATPDQALKQQVIAKLRTDLSGLTSPSREAFDFARYASNALMLLGDDAGLDVFLTDKENVSNYTAKDNWNPTTTPAAFQQLADQYTQLANDPSNTNSEVEKTMAAVYLRAKDRRNQGQDVKALQPIINMQNLRRF